MECLTNIALDFNAGNGSNETDTIESVVPADIVTNMMQNEKSTVEEFNCELFFKFVSFAISNNNIGKMLHYMRESMNTTFEKHKVQGSITSLQKVQSLKGRWFKVNIDNVEPINKGNYVEQNCIFLKDGKFYRVLSVFKKTYHKWRYERKGKTNEKKKVHLQVLENTMADIMLMMM